MLTVTYDAEFSYGYLPGHDRVPMLSFIIGLLGNTTGFEVSACIDTGAGRSLFNGRLAVGLGLDLFDGSPIRLSTVTGQGLQARGHRVQLRHETLGDFDLEIGFSTDHISRNILGRDFLDRVQIGFREHRNTFYVTPTP